MFGSDNLLKQMRMPGRQAPSAGDKFELGPERAVRRRGPPAVEDRPSGHHPDRRSRKSGSSGAARSPEPPSPPLAPTRPPRRPLQLIVRSTVARRCASGMVKPAPGGQLTPWKLVAPSTTSASSTSRCAPPFPCTPIPPLHACSMLTCLLLCHRSLLGRIFESKNISHIGVDRARRACHLRRGRARAREAVARGLGRSVLCRVLCYPRPARKPPVHGICCRTFVSCRVPFSGIYIYIVYKCVCPWLSADRSRATREISENGISIPSLGMAGDAAVMRSALVTLSAHRFGSWTRRTPTHRMVSGQLSKAQTRPSRPQTRESRADESSRRVPNRSSRAPWKALLASSRPARGLLSIMRLTRHHVVLGPSPNPRGVTLSRPVYRKTDAPLTRTAAQR